MKCSAIISSLESTNLKTYSLLTCHFGDTFWINTCISNVLRFTGDELKEIYIINQNRDQNKNLSYLPKVSRVLEFEPNQKQISMLGHDHPASLDSALQEIEFHTSHVIILDSDCFPIAENWINSDFDIQLASDPNAPGLTHPCFVVIPTRLLKKVSFSYGINEVGFDTGRLIGLQLSQMNESFLIDAAAKGFNGTKGTLYSNGKVFHFGSGSFAYSVDKRLNAINPLIVEKYFERKISKNVFSLNLFERFIFSLGFAIKSSIQIFLKSFRNVNK